MSFSHMIILGIIILLVVPPEKLPEMAKQIAKFLFELKRGADQVLNDLKSQAAFKPEDIIDQNIKDKFAELQKTLNQPLETQSSPNHHLESAPPSTQTPFAEEKKEVPFNPALANLNNIPTEKKKSE